MNSRVIGYIQARVNDPKPENRRLIFAAVVRSIAQTGTMEDLRALVNYYEKEAEELLQ